MTVECLKKLDRLGDNQTIAPPIVRRNHIQITTQITWQEVSERLALQAHIERGSQEVPI